MTTFKEELLNTLDALTQEQFEYFQWYLKEEDVQRKFSPIPVARLEGASRLKTVDLLVETYGTFRVLERTMTILQKINRNDLAQCLTDTSLRDRQNFHTLSLCESEKRQAKIRETKAQIKLMIQDRQMKIIKIKRSAELCKKSSETQISDSLRVFHGLVDYVQSSLDKLIDEIEEKRSTAQKQAESVIQQLEHEISELTKSSSKMDQLSHSEKDLDLLQSFSSTAKLAEISVCQPSYVESVTTTVNQLKEKLSTEMNSFLTKAELNSLQQFAVDVTLDPDTAHPSLKLTDNGKEVYCSSAIQHVQDNPKRFNSGSNVLGKQSFSSGRFYYEVQVKGKTAWDLGVVKESITRKGSISASPENGFWTICLRRGNKIKASDLSINAKIHPKKVGIFVDYDKGLVVFYNVDSAQVIHHFTNCSFKEKLYPFFSPGTYHDGQNSSPLIISPFDKI
ncbi:uncharacterized protein KZ484_019582 isoform 2-T3 [Pholidichthys leucotaenia]